MKIKIIFTIPPNVIVKRVMNRIKKRILNKINKKKDLSKETKTKTKVRIINKFFLTPTSLDLSKIDKKIANNLSKMYFSHRFDLLGTGWVYNKYDSISFGLEKHKYNMNLSISNFDKNGDWLEKVVLEPHLESSKEIWKEINSEDYIPIDWQKDFKSGYRLSAKKWYKDQKFNEKKGIDIKVPWELARLQHLPQLAIFSTSFPELKKQNILEFKNQIIDFIATNPPRMGVNWYYSMEVGIRAANMLLAYDLFTQIDDEGILNKNFKQIFSNSIFEHGLHIIKNLEWRKEFTNNHYLSNIAGLTYISSYLSWKDEKIKNWFIFSVQELLVEFKKQFYEDGGNFEASTSYHRLSGELIIYSLSLIFGVLSEKKEDINKHQKVKLKVAPKIKKNQEWNVNRDNIFPDWVFERLFKSGLFTKHITKQNSNVSQIGDNDSGRFFKLTPTGNFFSTEEAKNKYKNLENYSFNDKKFWDEDFLDHTTFLSCFSGFFYTSDFSKNSSKAPLEKSVIENLLKNKKIKVNIDNKENLNINKKENLKYKKTKIFKSNKNLLKNLKFYAYQNSGIYIFKSEKLDLVINATNIGQNGIGGHSHCDKLAFDLSFDGEEIIKDPGTYLYTPIVRRRNEFRGINAHNTIIVKNEKQNTFGKGFSDLFSMKEKSSCKVLFINKSKLAIECNVGKIKHIRSFVVKEREVEIIDECNFDFKSNFNKFSEFSNGYGKLFNQGIKNENNAI